ncbi:MAG: MotA/TolQ/ExbB proton channel family protein [Chitinivibrionales bacterium]
MDIPVVAMILRSGWIARIILLLLAFFSVITWAIIFNRLMYLGKIKRLNRLFRSRFESARSIRELEKCDRKLGGCPLGQLGLLSLKEYRRILSDAKSHSAVKDWSFYLQNQFHMASEHLSSAATAIGSRLDQGVFLLAIVGSIAPFLGLLGTVWGIMNSFYQIGNQGSASLPVVAPGIAEALITTIIGLAVAIPAVFFYNIFVHRAGRLEDEMDEFGDQALLRLKREIFSLLYGDRDRQPPAGA